jgi:hypothetical protein
MFWEGSFLDHTMLLTADLALVEADHRNLLSLGGRSTEGMCLIPRRG